MISVEEAQAIIRAAIGLGPLEKVALAEAADRTLAEPVIAKLTQPPFDASAMDGYAVKLDDVRNEGARLKVIGVSSAGERYSGAVATGEAVRIYTGAPMPEGADHVIIQENVTRGDDAIVINVAQTESRNIRKAGIDFHKGDILIEPGAALTGPRLALAAAGNNTSVTVYRRPRIALIANGDELVMPGENPGRDQIICSIPQALAPMIRNWGGDAAFLGLAPDDLTAMKKIIAQAMDYDLVVPIGGASVGDRDFMRQAFADFGFVSKFEKVAVKPGKPAWFGLAGGTAVIGLPGNPASALVTAILFVMPAIKAMLGHTDNDENKLTARLAAPLKENGPRETYLRGKISAGNDGAHRVMPHPNQDSSLLLTFAQSNALIRRMAHEAAAGEGDVVECLRI